MNFHPTVLAKAELASLKVRGPSTFETQTRLRAVTNHDDPAQIATVTQDVMAVFTGNPTIPSGLPCGVLAFMFANGKRRVSVRRAGAMVTVDVPCLDPGSSVPVRPYYAVIQTDPLGIMVATLAKGAQDLIAAKDGKQKIIELGQPRDLHRCLTELGVGRDDNADIDQMHRRLISGLLRHGHSVRIEAPFEAAIRETREEHGFDLLQCCNQIGDVNPIVGQALSKRRLSKPIDHILYVCQVEDFDDTVPAVSTIVEEKNPLRFGSTYTESGVYLSLPEMHGRLQSAAQTFHADRQSYPNADCELIVTQSRLALIQRIEDWIMTHATGAIRPA